MGVKGGDRNVWRRVLQFFVLVAYSPCDDGPVFFHDARTKRLYDVRVWAPQQKQFSFKPIGFCNEHTRQTFLQPAN
jgi:hypothetical protein